jgi:hypothetical protein
MPETSQFTFSFKEIVTALIKAQDIHEGIWGLFINFGLQATNIGPTDSDLRPAAIIPALAIGLQKFEKETSLSVDAAKVNPEIKVPQPGKAKKSAPN